MPPSESPATAGPDRPTPPEMVRVGTHSLALCIAGPAAGADHTDDEPLVVIFPGAGDAASSYVAVEPLLRPFTRVLRYDRSGLGRSESAPVLPNADSDPISVTAAKELGGLLDTVQINAPLILVAHSYGALVAREFVALFPDRVAGMVLCDASTERASEFFDPADENIAAVLGNLNFARVTGLRQTNMLSDEEWRIRARDIYAGFDGAKKEVEGFEDVCRSLGEKRQFEKRVLGDRPVSVIRANTARDYERIYEEGVRAGNGTDEQRTAFRELLDRWDGLDAMLQEEQLMLSSTTRYVRVDCGHNIHLVRPGVIAEEVRWVRDMIVSRHSSLRIVSR